MQGQQKDVVKHITSAAQLESELQISQAQHGVAVLDVYNTEWGHTKALSETFRLLHTNAGDTVHLRFFAVECNAVMESLQDPEDRKKAIAKPKGLQPSPDTLPAFWTTYVQNRICHSKPYFMFFKEGKFRAQLEGIDTPRITRIVNDLCKQENPVGDYITNTDLLAFWQRHFSNEESEVPLTRFMHAIREERTKAGLAELTSADIASLAAAVNAQGDTVGAAGCQSWVGPRGTVLEKVAELVGAATAPQTNLEPAFAASPSATESHDRNVVSATTAAPRASASYSRDLQSWQEIHDEPAASAGGEHDSAAFGAAGQTADASREEEVPSQQQHSPSLSRDPQSWHEIHNSVAAPQSEEREEATEAPADQWAELGDEEEARAKASPPEAAEPGAPPADQWAELGDKTPDEEGSAEAPVEQQNSWAELEGDEEGVAGDGHPEEGAVANQIYVNEQWVRVSDEEMRVWNVVAELPLHYPEREGSMLTVYTTDAAVTLPALADDEQTLSAFLEAHGASQVDVNMMCLAADQKIGSESVSLGKLALVLMSCDGAASQKLIAQGEDYYGEVCDGSLLRVNPALGYTALCLCASQAYPDEYFFYVPNEQDMECLRTLNEGDEAVLAALAPLSTQVPEGAYGVRVMGLPKVIELATTDQREETMVLSQWFSRLVVAEKTDSSVTLSFLENIANDRFEAFATAYTARLLQDESQLDKKTAAIENAPGMADEEL